VSTCFYHDDLDGKLSAAIVYKYDQNCNLISCNHTSKPRIDLIQKDERIYIVDFSFKPEVMEEVLKVTEDVIWIDHHKTALDYKYSREIKGLRIIEPNCLAGCELTWIYLYPNVPRPPAVLYVGDVDKWAWQYKEITDYFIEGLKVHITTAGSETWEILLKDNQDSIKLTDEILMKGRLFIDYRNHLCENYYVRHGYETMFEGYKCCACGFTAYGSKLFGDRADKYDMMIGHEWIGDKWVVSLFSTKNIDVSVIAKKYGGGGHLSAAGFSCADLPFRKLIGEYNP